MLKVAIENQTTGPLAHRRTLLDVLAACDRNVSLDDVKNELLRVCLGRFSVYRGGSHIAIHPIHRGQIAEGRVAIITEERGLNRG